MPDLLIASVASPIEAEIVWLPASRPAVNPTSNPATCAASQTQSEAQHAR